MNIPIILGSVREGRKSEMVARLMFEKVQALGHETQIVDFKELQLPFLDSPLEPSDYNKNYPYEVVNQWSRIADAADAFVFVAPEYNHGYSGVLKNALDWLYPEFNRKAAGLVGVSSGKVGGARAIEQLRTICGNFGMYDIKETVMFAPAKDAFNEAGMLTDESYNKRIDGFLKSLVIAGEAMRAARNMK
jgi:NAD(P)H-dependent FMN reductase